MLSSIFLLFSTSSFPSKDLPYRYTVYVEEARKRLIYTVLSLFLAFLCAYTERVALMYLIAYPLQQALFQEGHVEMTQRENIIFGQESNSTLYSPYSTAIENGGVRLIFTDVQEAFYTLLSMCLFWCLLACLAIFFYHAWCFLQPGVYAWKGQRVRAFLFRGMLFVYLVLWLVNKYLFPRLLSFFYAFEIERGSLCVNAEIKVVSYVSLYLFVNLITLALCVLTALYRLYMQKQIFFSFRLLNLSTATSRQCKLSRKQLTLPRKLSLKYQDQRSKLWWGCLLVSAILCPPEISSQLFCALFLILINETSLWLAYISSYRFLTSKTCKKLTSSPAQVSDT